MYRIKAISTLPQGYLDADYFLDNVLSRSFATEAEAEVAARASYRGTDRFGDGLEWDVVETR
jgi:hypothetical protein